MHPPTARAFRLRLKRFVRVVVPTTSAVQLGAAFAFVGAFVLTEFDKILETSLTNAMPGWLTNLTTRL